MNALNKLKRKRELGFNTLHSQLRFIYFRRIFVAKKHFLKLNKAHRDKRTFNIVARLKVFADKQRLKKGISY